MSICLSLCLFICLSPEMLRSDAGHRQCPVCSPPPKKLFPVKFVFAKGLLVALIDVLVCWTLNKFVSVPVMCSGVPLCAWHSTGIPVRQPAADIRDVTVFTLLTPRHCRCRRLVGLPLATVPFQWLQRGHRTVCHQRLGPAAHFWHFEGTRSLPFLSHTADLALSI